jgi:uncharacterized delta-60 repeat protein
MKRALIGGAVGLTLLLAAPAQAKPGHLDQSFGNRGRVTLPSVMRGGATSTDVGGRGRIVVAGANQDEFIVERLNANGSPDRDFGGGDGIARVRIDSPRALAPWAAIADNGSVVVAGRACTADGVACHIVVTRLTRTGQLNHHFGDQGLVQLDFGRQSATEPSVAFTINAGIIIKATDCVSGNQGDCDVGVARLFPDGTLDPKFGHQGKAVTPTFFRALGSCASRFKYGAQNVDSMAVEPRGAIVVLLTCANKENPALARFKPTGHIDRSFGDNGTVFKDVGMKAAISLTTDSQKRIDVAGAGRSGFVIARFTDDGRLDRSFGKRGTATARFDRAHKGDPPAPFSVDVDSRGRIVASGALFVSRFDTVGAFARFTRDGRVNRRFGHRGKVTVGRGLRFVGSSAIDSHDRIVGAGNAVIRLLG